jgi:hypothetical protein
MLPRLLTTSGPVSNRTELDNGARTWLCSTLLSFANNRADFPSTPIHTLGISHERTVRVGFGWS